MLDAIRLLYRYDSWAARRILETTEPLTAQQFLAPEGANGWSLRDTLVHALSGQWIWLERWEGASPPAMLRTADYPSLASISDRSAEVAGNLQAFLANLSEEELRRVVHYLNTRGQPFAYPLWQLMLHQVNHGTQHRSEAAVLLTQFGHSPGEMDLVTYLALVAQAGS